MTYRAETLTLTQVNKKKTINKIGVGNLEI